MNRFAAPFRIAAAPRVIYKNASDHLRTDSIEIDPTSELKTTRANQL